MIEYSKESFLIVIDFLKMTFEKWMGYAIFLYFSLRNICDKTK